MPQPPRPTAGPKAGPRPVPPKPPGKMPPPRLVPPAPPPRPAAVPPAAARHLRRRPRWALVASFLLCVATPSLIAAAYLELRAADQYRSTVAFAVRTEHATSASDFLGGLAQLTGGGTSSDTSILYQFIQSQELIERLDRRLDLRGMFARAHATDPVFAFDPTGSLEDLVAYWQRMVGVSVDGGTGLVQLGVNAFSPGDAQRLAAAIYEESSEMINALSRAAQEDATRYARDELAQAEVRLKAARQALAEFRSRTQIVDPTADIKGQMGLLNTLQEQLAAALIDLDLLRETTKPDDPRVLHAQRRIEVIRDRIEEERAKFGDGAGGDYVRILSEFERMSVDQEFAEKAYLAALAAFDAAQAEAQRKSRYLAAYIRPTLAETAQYPRREMLAWLVALFLFLVWAIGGLAWAAIRDRR